MQQNKRPEGNLLDDPRGSSEEFKRLRRERERAVASRADGHFENRLEVADQGLDDYDDCYQPTNPEPTDARQGTRAKLDVMAARVANGEDMWHDEDGGHDEDDDSMGPSGAGTVSCRRGGITVRDV